MILVYAHWSNLKLKKVQPAYSAACFHQWKKEKNKKMCFDNNKIFYVRESSWSFSKEKRRRMKVSSHQVAQFGKKWISVKKKKVRKIFFIRICSKRYVLEIMQKFKGADK